MARYGATLATCVGEWALDVAVAEAHEGMARGGRVGATKGPDAGRALWRLCSAVLNVCDALSLKRKG